MNPGNAESTKVHPMVSLGKYCNHRSSVVPPTFRFWWVALVFRFTPRVSFLVRNIGQTLDHFIRPVPLAASEVESLGHLDFYLSDSLLDPRFLDRPVAYQTSYSSSQWGSRLLAAEKIGISFGLPGRLRVGELNTATFPFEPVQLLAGCLDSLGEDACVMTHMWDRCVVLPLPGAQGGLMLLRSCLQIRETHGSDWLEQLKVLRTTMRQNRGKGPNGQTGGFQKKKNTSNKPESGFIGSSSCRPVPTSAATELLRDAVAGMSFLSKMCNSSWWNWSLVSTLAFWCWPEGEQGRAFRDGMDPYCQ